MGSTITPVDTLKGRYPTLTLKQSIALMESLRLCWSEDVLVISCSDKFLRLSLQLLSRSAYTNLHAVSYHFCCFEFGFYIHSSIYECMYRMHMHKLLMQFIWHALDTQIGCLLVLLLAKGMVCTQTLLLAQIGLPLQI